MMKNTSIKLNSDFRRIYSRGKSFVCSSLVVYVMKNKKTKVSRLGLTVGKTVGNAVKRNRAKRLLREAYRKTLDVQKTGYDMIIVARTRINGKKSDNVLSEFEYALRKLDMLKDEENIT